MSLDPPLWSPPPPASPPPPHGQTPLVDPPVDSMTGGDKEDKEELMYKEELMTLLMLQGTLHCSCFEHCFLLD